MTTTLRKKLLVNIAWVTGLALLVVLLIGGSLMRLGSHKQRVACLTQEIDAKRGSIRPQSESDDAAFNLQENESALREWQDMTENESDRIAALSAAANGSGMSIVSLQSSAKSDNETSPTLSRTHQLSGVGTYDQIAEFLGGIYNARGMAAIDHLTIKHERGSAWGMLRASMEVSWHGPNPNAEDEQEPVQ